MQLKLIFLFLISVALLQAQPEIHEKIGGLIRKNKDAEARTMLLELYAKNSKDPEVNYFLSVISVKERDAEKALKYIEVSIDGDPASAKYFLMQGNAYGVKAQNEGMFKAMIDAGKVKSNYEKAVELKPDYIPARYALFQFLLMAPGIAGGDNEKAKELAEGTMPYNAFMANTMMGFYYFRAEEDVIKAEAALKKGLQIQPGTDNYDNILSANVGLLNMLGYHFLKGEEKAISRTFFRQAIEAAPEFANGYDSMGDYYYEVSKPDSALIYYDKALQINPSFSASRLNKAKILEQNGKKSEAKQIYQALVKEEPASRAGKEAAERLDNLE